MPRTTASDKENKSPKRHFIAISTGAGKTDTFCICYCANPFADSCKVTQWILQNLDDTEELDSEEDQYDPDSPSLTQYNSPEFDLRQSHV